MDFDPFKLMTAMIGIFSSCRHIFIHYAFILFFRYSWLRLLFVLPEIILATLLSICAENFAVLTMWVGDWYDFYIVEKESDIQEEILLEVV